MYFNAIFLVPFAATTLALPSSADSAQANTNSARSVAIKNAFRSSWNAYYKQAFPHDTLDPIPNENGTNSEDDRNGWGVTIVDSLDTAVIMGESETINQMLDHIAKIDFTTTKKENDSISVFETTIRYLGGLISGYELLKGPLKQNGIDSSKVDLLLTQAKSLADSISIAFDTASGLPDPVVYLNPARVNNNTGNNNLAEAGTLVMEWTRLSDLSGDTKYAELVKKAESYLINPTGSPEAWPGLVGTFLSTGNGSFLDSRGGWSGGTDSFYEYLIKMYQYDPVEFAEYKDRWVLAAESTMAHLASHPTTRSDLTYLSQFNGNRTAPVSTHLASFAGGNFILGGVLLGEDKYTEFGLKITESYFNNYLETPAGMGPEIFRWVDPKLSLNDTYNRQPLQNQTEFYSKAGFYTTNGVYVLRPETIESLYYAYRLTGDSKWQDMAWQAYENIEKSCGTQDGAFTSLDDVMLTNGTTPINSMESFWLAETLKYLYLIFTPESPIQISLNDSTGGDYVFNTEAHPMLVRGRY